MLTPITSTALAGNIIHRIREDNDMSRAKLAELTGVSPRSLYALEKGESENFGLGKFLRVADALGLVVSIDLKEKPESQAPKPKLDLPRNNLADIWKLDRDDA